MTLLTPMSLMAGAEREFHRIRPQSLPIELIVYIIGILADGSFSKFNHRDHSIFPTLATSSLVCRAWNAICRSHIFHTIMLQSESPSSGLCFIQFEASHLIKYIRKLCFRWGNNCTVAEWLPGCYSRLLNLCEVNIRYETLRSQPHIPRSSVSARIASMLAAPPSCLRKLHLVDFIYADDGSDLLRILPTILEELSLMSIASEGRGTHVGEPSTVRCLEALRTLESVEVTHPMIRFRNFIECPNLKHFTARSLTTIPPWIPADLSELVLDVRAFPFPNFGTVICPSAVTIYIVAGRKDPYEEAFTRIQYCVNHLPFPDSIQKLSITIMNHVYDGIELYPRVSHYATFSQSLLGRLRCYGHGNLETIILKIHANMLGSGVVLRTHDMELGKMEKGLADLVKANVLDAEFTLGEPTYGPYMQCNIRRV